MSGSRLTPYTIAEDPVRVPDGEGGFTLSRDMITDVIYMQVSWHENLPSAQVRMDTAIKIKSLVDIQGAVYEVTGIETSGGSGYKTVRFKRSDRPINIVTN